MKVLSRARSLLRQDESILNASVRACLTALSQGGFSVESVDCIVCVSNSFRPSSFTAENVKRHLGMFKKLCSTENVSATMYQFSQLVEEYEQRVQAGMYQRVLILNTDGSKLRLNWSCGIESPLSGEAVSAFVVGQKELATGAKMEVCS